MKTTHMNLECVSSNLAPKSEVANHVSKWLQKNFQPEDYNLTGPNLGRQFEVFFAGAGGLAALQAKNQSPSKWRLGKIVVPTPDAKEVQLYVGPDQSQQKIAQQRMCKTNADSLVKTHPSLHSVKNGFIVFSGWTPIGKAAATSREDQKFM